MKTSQHISALKHKIDSQKKALHQDKLRLLACNRDRLSHYYRQIALGDPVLPQLNRTHHPTLTNKEEIQRHSYRATKLLIANFFCTMSDHLKNTGFTYSDIFHHSTGERLFHHFNPLIERLEKEGNEE